MKNLNLLIALILSNTFSYAQEVNNFYDFLEQHHEKWKDTPDSIRLKTHQNKVIERLSTTWVPRLYPRVDFTKASKAITDYSINCLEKPQYNSEWECLGPTGLPEVYLSSANSLGNGRINRLAFDPNYNGTTNQTVYAASSHGGLWRSENDGAYWSVVNTDQLPLASASDVVINPINSNQIFISTGHCDDKFYTSFSQNNSSINPIYTTGVYRSNDYGSNWEPINDGLLSNFTDGGTIRELEMNPSNSNQLFVASSRGVFKTDNANAANPNWTYMTPSIIDQQFRGIEFKPGTTPGNAVVYASGQEVYKWEESSGNWTWMTDPIYGLDLSDLQYLYNINYNAHDVIEIKRINIATTEANPNLLYTYIIGSLEYIDNSGPQVGNAAFIYYFNGSNWNFIHARTNIQFTGNSNNATGVNVQNSLSVGRMAIVPHPTNPFSVYFGTTKLHNSLITPNSSQTLSPYSGNGFHADVHDLAFKPNSLELFCTHDGGVSKKDISNNPTGIGGWTYLCQGLQVATIWSFDDADYDENIISIATQDCGNSVRLNPNGTSYEFGIITDGDGYSSQINDDELEYIFIDVNNHVNYRYNIYSNTLDNESSLLPADPHYVANGFSNAGSEFPKTLKMINHPLTEKMHWGLSEVFSREQINPASWTVQSDFGNHEPTKWKRQITELEIAKSDPNYLYAAVGASDHYNFDNLVLRTKNGGLDGNYTPGTAVWENISNNLPLTSEQPYVTGIAVSSRDAEKIWLSFSGYEDAAKVWTSDDAGDSFYSVKKPILLGCVEGPIVPEQHLQHQKGQKNAPPWVAVAKKPKGIRAGNKSKKRVS